MYKQCRTEQSAKRQRELEQGLLRVMLKKHYDEISVCDLCDEIGVPRKSFYRYFSSKDGALHALIDHALMDYDTFTQVDNMQKKPSALKYMEGVFEYWIQCKPLLDVLARSGLSGVLIQRAIEYSKQTDSLPTFLTSEDKQMLDYITMFTVCGLMTLLVQWHHDGFNPPSEQMAHLALRLMSKPIVSVLE